MAKKRGGLGRGLDALFADAAPIYEEENDSDIAETADIEETSGASKGKTGRKAASGTGKASGSRTAKAAEGDDTDRVIYADINDIKPNRAQPRKTFNEEKLQELADSIKSNGVIQPLVVRKSETGFELVTGERRWRASRLAGLKSVPVIVRDFDEKQNAVVTVIENMQREDLNPIEEAEGLDKMVRNFGFTQEEAAKAVGKSRAYIANSLRLLKLPASVKDRISDGSISAAHGRTIINVRGEDKQVAICEKIIRNGLSVRATERLAERIKDEARLERKRRRVSKADPEISAAEDDLRKILGTKVRINGNANAGRIELEYYSMDELNGLLDMLKGIGDR